MKCKPELQVSSSSLGELIAKFVFYCLFIFIILSSTINFLIIIWKRTTNLITGLIIDKVDLYIQQLSEFSEIEGKNRLQAIKLLGKLNDTRAIEPLIRVLQKDPVAANRMIAAYTLSQFDDERALRALINALKDNDSLVKHKVVEILKQSNRNDVLGSLIPLLYEESLFLRKTICKILSDSKLRLAIPHLVFLLDDKSILLQKSAKEALEKIDSVFNNCTAEISLVNASCESCRQYNLILFTKQDKLYCGYCQSWQSTDLA